MFFKSVRETEEAQAAERPFGGGDGVKLEPRSAVSRLKFPPIPSSSQQMQPHEEAQAAEKPFGGGDGVKLEPRSAVSRLKFPPIPSSSQQMQPHEEAQAAERPFGGGDGVKLEPRSAVSRLKFPPIPSSSQQMQPHEEAQAAERPFGGGDGVKLEPRSTVSRLKFPRIPSSSQQSVRDDTGVQTRVLKRPQEKIFSEYRDNFKACPVQAVHIRKPTDCIHLTGKMDLLTNYADAYKGVKGEAAKLIRHPVTVGSEARPIKIFSEYQDTFKTWTVPPVRSFKPMDYRPPGRQSFVTCYAQDYKLKKIQRRLPIIHLQQTAMPTGRFESITSYRNDFTGKPDKRPPSSGRPTGGETQHLLKRRQHSCSTSAKERPQPPVPAHRDRGHKQPGTASAH